MRVYKEVARFAGPSYIGDLFWNMSLKGAFWSVKANTVKVHFVCYWSSCFFWCDVVLCADPDAIACA